MTFQKRFKIGRKVFLEDTTFLNGDMKTKMLKIYPRYNIAEYKFQYGFTSSSLFPTQLIQSI